MYFRCKVRLRSWRISRDFQRGLVQEPYPHTGAGNSKKVMVFFASQKL